MLTDSVSHSASLHPRGHWLAWQACRRLGYRMGGGRSSTVSRSRATTHRPSGQPTQRRGEEESLSQRSKGQGRRKRGGGAIRPSRSWEL